MLDINAFLVEKGGDPEIIKASQKKRGDSVELVDEIIAEYKEWVKLRFDLDEHNKKLNSVQKEIGKRFKAKEDAKDLIAEKEKLSNEKKEIIEKEAEADKNLRSKINQVGNIVHESVVDSQDEEYSKLCQEIIDSANLKAN